MTNSSSLLLQGQTQQQTEENLSRKLTFSKVKSQPPTAARQIQRRRPPFRPVQIPEEFVEELDNGGILGSPEVASPTRKKGRVSFGSNDTRLYHPGDVVSTKKRKQVDGGDTEPVLKKR